MAHTNLYVISAKNRLRRIGVAEDIHARLTILSEDYSGLKIEFSKRLDTEEAQRVVQRVHAALEAVWVDNWFRASAAEVRSAIDQAEAGSLLPDADWTPTPVMELSPNLGDGKGQAAAA